MLGLCTSTSKRLHCSIARQSDNRLTRVWPIIRRQHAPAIGRAHANSTIDGTSCIKNKKAVRYGARNHRAMPLLHIPPSSFAQKLEICSPRVKSTRMLAINVSIPNLTVARLEQFPSPQMTDNKPSFTRKPHVVIFRQSPFAANAVLKLVAMATSLRPSISAMLLPIESQKWLHGNVP